MTLGALRVLLVDDDPDDAAYARAVLAEIRGARAAEVVWMPWYDDALDAIRRDDFDVCLLDHFLGARDGLGFIEEAIAGGATVPIIFLTGRGDGRIEQSALAAGAADYLLKSELAPAALERAIRHAIERGLTLTELRASERRFRALFDHALDAMLISDDQARYVDGNPAALALLGVTREQLVQMSVADIAAGESDMMGAWRTFITNGRLEGDLAIRRTDGELRTTEFRAVANIIPGNHLSVMRDITDRRRAEQNQLRLTTIVDAAEDAIDGISPDGVINFWSAGAERLYGFTRDEVLGQSKAMLMPPERAGELALALAQLRRGESIQHWETLRRRRDGTIFEASVAMSPIREAGATVGVSVVTRDITEKKRLENQVAISDRMVSVGTLAAGVAHEINNPLAAVIANLEMIDEDLTELDHGLAAGALREMVVEARAGADRIRHIVRDLRLFSRPDEDRREAIDVEQVIESSARMAWNEIRHRAQLIKSYGACPPVWGNESRLGQVILNLVVNAAHAIDEGHSERHEIRLVTRTDDEAHAIIEVQDTGKGVAPEHLEHLFDPFFTTKPIGVGTGLGLSICQRIVNEMGGTISVTSVLGAGTTFRVTLPSTTMRAPPARARARPVTRAPRHGKILVVDDDPAILLAVDRTLRTDHDVTTVSAARDALGRIGAGERFDVIVCDVMMPEMSGMDLYVELAMLAPDQAAAVVFLTGGAFTPAAVAFLDNVTNVKLDKPFSALDLRRLVRDRVRDLA